MKIVEDETKSVAGFEFGVPRYRTTLRFPQTAKESDAETAAPVMLAPVVSVSTIENLRTAAKSLLRPMLAKVPLLIRITRRRAAGLITGSPRTYGGPAPIFLTTDWTSEVASLQVCEISWLLATAPSSAQLLIILLSMSR
jgi:hypothetical protein